MVEIQCLACEKIIKPLQLNDNENYDTESYEGQVVCQKCKAVLYVKSVKGKVQNSKIVEKAGSKEQKINIIVQDEETKQLMQKGIERTNRQVE